MVKAFQSEIIILWTTGDGNTAAEDKGLPYTVLSVGVGWAAVKKAGSSAVPIEKQLEGERKLTWELARKRLYMCL